jgi:hypothetical protein
LHANSHVMASFTGSESPHSIRMKVTASVGSAAVVLDSEAGEVLRAAMENLTAGAQKYPKTLAMDLELHAVGITSPEGTFLRSGAQLMHSSSLITSKHGAKKSHRTCLALGAACDHIFICLSGSWLMLQDVMVLHLIDRKTSRPQMCKSNALKRRAVRRRRQTLSGSVLCSWAWCRTHRMAALTPPSVWHCHPATSPTPPLC